MGPNRGQRLFDEAMKTLRRWSAVVVLGSTVLLVAARSADAAEVPEDPGLAERYLAAVAAYEAHRFEEARSGFETLATEGVAQAEFMLGVMHEYGDGVEVSYSDAVRWYEAAAERGLTSAETRLGSLYVDGTGVPPDAQRARLWLERAARKRDPLALFMLGDLSAHGQGVPQSLEDAYAYYLLAEGAGSTKAEAAITDLDQVLSRGRRAEAARRASVIASSLALAETAPGETPSEPEQPAVRPRSAIANLRLTRATVKDDGLGGTALQLLVPRGWTLSGGIVWRPDSASPASLDLRVESDDSGLRYRVFPQRSYVWRSRGEDVKTRPFIGPRGYEPQPPIGDAIVFIEKMVLPEHHRAGSYEVLERHLIPTLARAIASGAHDHGSSDVSAARVRIRVRGEQRTFEEDLYCVLVQTRKAERGEELVFWGPERLYSFRALEGQLDEHYGVLQSVASSLRFDDGWTGRYFMLRADIRERPGRSRITEREFALFLQSARDSHANARSNVAVEQEQLRLRANVVLAAELGRTEIFLDPRSEREVALPKGFARAWGSSRGDFLLSTDSWYDPRDAAPTEGWAELHAVSAR